MKFNKISAILGIVVVIVALVVSSLIRDMQESKERTRIANLLVPVLAKTTEAATDPKPTLSFVTLGHKTTIVVLNWESTPEADVKNDLREKISLAFRRELAADPASWGGYVAVLFSDEVITQGAK